MNFSSLLLACKLFKRQHALGHGHVLMIYTCNTTRWISLCSSDMLDPNSNEPDRFGGIEMLSQNLPTLECVSWSMEYIKLRPKIGIRLQRLTFSLPIR